MKKIILLVMLVLVNSAFGAEGKHVIAVGAGGFGWAGLSEKQTSKTSSSFDTTNGASSLSLNYAHYFSSGFIVGGSLSTDSQEQKFSVSGANRTDKWRSGEVAVNLGYNFSDDFYNSWWLLGSLGAGAVKSETNTSGSSVSRSSLSYSKLGIFVGKRFSLKSFGIEQISYAPSVGIYVKSYGGDVVNDLRARGAMIEPIRFELLF